MYTNFYSLSCVNPPYGGMWKIDFAPLKNVPLLVSTSQVAQWLPLLLTEQKIGGSIPGSSLSLQFVTTPHSIHNKDKQSKSTLPIASLTTVNLRSKKILSFSH